VAQFNHNADTKYQRPAFLIRLAGSYTATSTESNPEHDPDDRGYFEGTYARFMTRRWAFTGIGRFETNESLGILLRSEVGAAIGPRFLDTNRAQAWVGGGLIVNHENGVDVEPTKNIEAMLIAHAGYFTYDQPETTIDITLQYFPSLNDPGRHRVQLDASIKRELLKDFIVTLNLYDSYDNRPPNAAFDTNDVGIVFSLGWTY
jgi:hypothetical protein